MAAARITYHQRAKLFHKQWLGKALVRSFCHIVALSATALLFSVSAQADPAADAAGKVDYWMKVFKETVYARAVGSGSKFPNYNRWLGDVVSAVRSGTKPEHLDRGPDPFAPLPKDVQTFLADSKAAKTELAAFTPPAPETKDLESMAAYQQRTEPRGLAKIMLTVFSRESAAVRTAGATYISAHYKLPS